MSAMLTTFQQHTRKSSFSRLVTLPFMTCATRPDIFPLPTTRYLACFALVAALHAIAIYALLSNGGSSSRPVAPSQSLITIFLRPAIRDAEDTPSGPDLSMLVIRTDTPRTYLDIPTPALTYDAPRNASATVSAPSLRPDNAISLAPFITQAGLLPGEGATVVLRIEVLPSGNPGVIAIDASSGSRQIDQAAINYARQHRWYAGRAGDTPIAMWIRWGVRLQA